MLHLVIPLFPNVLFPIVYSVQISEIQGMDLRICRDKCILSRYCFVFVCCVKTSETVTKDSFLSGMGKGQQRKHRQREIREK